jgi:hypothetical protein
MVGSVVYTLGDKTRMPVSEICLMVEGSVRKKWKLNKKDKVIVVGVLERELKVS